MNQLILRVMKTEKFLHDWDYFNYFKVEEYVFSNILASYWIHGEFENRKFPSRQFKKGQ